MKNGITILLCLLLCSATTSAQFETKLSDGLFLSEIAANTWAVTHYFPWESNSLVVKASEKEVVLIDTPYTNEATAILLTWIRTNLNPEKITAINTGFHIDNLGGNQELIQNGSVIYGSDRTCSLIDERGLKSQQELISWLKPDQQSIKKAYQAMVFTKPTAIFNIEAGLNLSIGTMTFEVFYPGKSHSPDNVVVFIPELNLLFGGCMVKALTAKNLGFTSDANLPEWLSSLYTIKTKYPSSKIVVPHHGLWGSMQLIHHTINLLNSSQPE